MPVVSTSQTVIAAEEEGSPMQWRIRDEEIESALLYTPTKWLCLFEMALSSTSSGSFLMSSTPYDSSIQIIEPVIASVPASVPFPNWNLMKSPEWTNWVSWEMIEIENHLIRESLQSAQSQVLIRDLMMEETNAQLFYQNLHLQQQNRALHNKEKKKNEWSLLFNGEGKVLLSDAFTEKLQELQDVMAWQLECQCLALAGVAKRTWLKKPVRPLKPKLLPNLHPVDGEQQRRFRQRHIWESWSHRQHTKPEAR